MKRLAVTVAAAAVLGAMGVPALAAPTASAPLDCGAAGGYVVDGFGRGQVLHVVDSTVEFIVTRAQAVVNGKPVTVFEAPGLAEAEHVVTCTTTSPTGTSYVFDGFFTPRP